MTQGVDLAAEVERLTDELENTRNHLRVAREDLARTDAIATILADAREGLARAGSKAKGVQQVQQHLTAPVVTDAIETARRRVRAERGGNDRGKAAAAALSERGERALSEQSRVIPANEILAQAVTALADVPVKALRWSTITTPEGDLERVAHLDVEFATCQAWEAAVVALGARAKGRTDHVMGSGARQRGAEWEHGVIVHVCFPHLACWGSGDLITESGGQLF